MSTQLPSQYFSQFKGIREYSGVNLNGQISALTCKNVELFKTDIGDGTGIRTVDGDKIFQTLPTGYKAIKNFTSIQDGVSYMFIYGEDETKGTLFYVDYLGNLQTIIDDLTITGNANGLTMLYGEYDIFVFTNGIDKYTVCFAQTEQVRKIEAVDNLEREINWLSMTAWNGALYVASQYGVHFSHKNDIYTWNDVVNGVEDSGYIEFGKKVTAVISFSTGLFIFTSSGVSHLNTTPNDTENAILKDVAMNGCFSFESIVAHDTFLFFYDDNQKGVFYIQMTDTGQTRPTGPVSREIQSFLTEDIKRCKMFSCVYSTYNEIWLLINDKIIIYDYINQEFLERVMPQVNSICMYKNRPYVCGDDGKIKAEKISETFSGEYYPAEYKTSVINMGSNSNLKKSKTPILLVLNENFTNNFYVEVSADFKAKTPKAIKAKISNEGVWAPEGDVNDIEITSHMLWDEAFWASEDYYKKRVVEITTPPTWYTINFRFYTKELGDGFNIVALEMKRLKEKTKTKGR